MSPFFKLSGWECNGIFISSSKGSKSFGERNCWSLDDEDEECYKNKEGCGGIGIVTMVKKGKGQKWNDFIFKYKLGLLLF